MDAVDNAAQLSRMDAVDNAAQLSKAALLL
jgi:hypothetical protein